MNGSGEPSTKDLGNKIFDELKKKLERCGGDFYRANPGKDSGFYKASLESALESESFVFFTSFVLLISLVAHIHLFHLS